MSENIKPSPSGAAPTEYKSNTDSVLKREFPASKANTLTEARIKWAIENSLSMRQASRLLNSSYNTFKKYAKQYGLWAPNQSGIGISKGRIGLPGIDEAVSIKEIIRGKVPNIGAAKLQYLLIKEGYLLAECSNCSHSDCRKDGGQPLLLDFLDRDSHNHELSNLRLLCFNCYYLLSRPGAKWQTTPKTSKAMKGIKAMLDKKLTPNENTQEVEKLDPKSFGDVSLPDWFND